MREGHYVDDSKEEYKESTTPQDKKVVESAIPKVIRQNVYSQIESTGMTHRSQLRRKLVQILRDFVIAQNNQVPPALSGSKKKAEGAASSKGITEVQRRWAAECGLRLEEGLYALFKQGKAYTDKARSLLFNLSDPKNPDLKQRILDQELTARQVLTTDIRKLASKEMLKEREESDRRSLSGCRNDWEVERTLQASGKNFIGLFTCEQCGSKTTGYVQYQIDRADEPMTNFVFCYDCHHRWKC